MFSSSVIWAIHVLSELDKYRAQVSAERQGKKKVGMLFSTTNRMQKPVLRNVLKKMVTAGYIELLPGPSYELKMDIRKISVGKLIRLFHGNICIGEPYDHYQTIGRESFRTEDYRNLLQFENTLQESLEKQLQAVNISDFRL